MDKFNLIKEPWIPCLMLETSETKDLNLLDVLTQAHKIKEITDNSPLVVVSLHRFLLAILHRNFGPKSFKNWKELWRKGKWDEEKLKSYFDKYEDRFNLFDDERPFYQYPKVEGAAGKAPKIAPFATLMEEKAGGNNATLFDHSFDSSPQGFPPRVAARYLIARQAFSIGFGKSYPFYFKDSTLIRGFSILAVGKNLFESLALNLIVYRKDKPIPNQQDEEGNSLDRPFWERENLAQATEKDKNGNLPLGYLDYLTWQSRRIRLLPYQEKKIVKQVQLQQNFRIVDKYLFDPFKTYSAVEGEGWKTMKLIPDKALWRNSHSILHQFDNAKARSGKFYRSPQVINHLSQVAIAIDDGEIEGNENYEFAVYGIATDVKNSASVILWTQERLPLPLNLLNSPDLINKLETAINFAEDLGKIVRQSISEFTLALLPNIAGNERKKKSRELAENFPASSVYWSGLERAFKELMIMLPKETNGTLRKWFKSVDKKAWESFKETTNGISGSGKEFQAVIKAKSKYWRERSILLNGDGRKKEGNLEYKFYLSSEEKGEE